MVQGSGFRARSGFRVQGSGFRVQDSGSRVQGSGFRVQGSGVRVWGTHQRIRSKRGTRGVCQKECVPESESVRE
jgi:hypothetical protein